MPATTHLTKHADSEPTDPRVEDGRRAEARRMQEQGLALLERAYSPSGAPVLGLFVYVAETTLMRSLKRRKTYQAIVPSLIGTPAILFARPGISQTSLPDTWGSNAPARVNRSPPASSAAGSAGRFPVVTSGDSRCSSPRAASACCKRSYRSFHNTNPNSHRI